MCLLSELSLCIRVSNHVWWNKMITWDQLNAGLWPVALYALASWGWVVAGLWPVGQICLFRVNLLSQHVWGTLFIRAQISIRCDTCQEQVKAVASCWVAWPVAVWVSAESWGQSVCSGMTCLSDMSSLVRLMSQPSLESWSASAQVCMRGSARHLHSKCLTPHYCLWK